jgi:23S rRNA (uracil1939-C5)-methyltransferase
MDNMNTGRIVGLASEGQGIVRHEGLVTFIPFTATGDEIRYQTVQQKKNFAIGKLIDVIEPSPERITPLCQYFGTCGGCQLQHINYSAQLEYKRKWIEDALKKIGKLQTVSVPAVKPAHLQWSYRRRINLVLKKNQNAYKAGYFAIDNTSIVEVESCPIFTDKKDPILHAVQEISKQLISNEPFDGKVTILKSQDGYITHFHFKTLPENTFALLSSCLKTYPFITGILATSQRKSFQFGIIETSCEVGGLSFDFNPKSFIQTHPEQSQNIYNAIEELAKTRKPKSVLDLYCGIGISTLLVAKQGCKVKGVEVNPQSIELAKSNAKKNGLSQTQFVIADVEKVLPQLLENDKPDFIIVNPPREGLSPKITETLKAKPVKTLVYISCMPATLARDLKSLCESGYSVSSIEAFDMFPQTIHVETVVTLIS